MAIQPVAIPTELTDNTVDVGFKVLATVTTNSAIFFEM
jgi:hypothetical protein